MEGMAVGGGGLVGLRCVKKDLHRQGVGNSVPERMKGWRSKGGCQQIPLQIEGHLNATKMTYQPLNKKKIQLKNQTMAKLLILLVLFL